jgi:hypothetical protein
MKNCIVVLFAQQATVKVNKSMGWAAHVSPVGEIRNSYKTFSEYKERNHL